MDITLALGGGGAKGNAHIGVLRRLEKEDFKIRAVAGTSFGGVVAVMYAAGYTPDEIEDNFAKAINWLGMMEKVKPTTRICSVSIASAGKDKCRFDLVFEVPLVKKLPN